MKQFFVLSFALLLTSALSQKKKPVGQPEAVAPQQSAIEAKTSGMKRFNGFFNFFYDEKQDKILLIIEKFETEFLFVGSLTAGVGSNDIGLDRNRLSSEKVVKFQRRGPKVLLTEINLGYRALSNSAAERKAVEESFAQSVLFGFTVMAEENGNVLVDATDFLLQDVAGVVEGLKSANQGTYTLDKTRSALYPERIKSFPQNAEFESTLTFSGNPTGGYIRSVTPTPTLVTVRQHYSFIQLPDNKYKPRKFDPRAGYYPLSYYDYATPINEPIEKRFITRHRLEKKDPSAEFSEVVEPIIYYMDAGAPEPIRSALMEGARWWSRAFEAAGFRDAFRVEVLPEGADPMDVRYNIINWVHRSTRGWSYGSSITDPRTGEILKGHVNLGSLRVRQDFLIAEGLLAPYSNELDIDNGERPGASEMEKMALARLRQLAAHEVGHTLGLSHAYSASSQGLASVMDYPHPFVKITDGKIDLRDAYYDRIGVFDMVMIRYGYAQFKEGQNEDDLLNKIIERANDVGLTFLTDQDARPAGSAHPRAHLWDNGLRPEVELNRVLEIRALALKNFGQRNVKIGAPLATLEEALVPIYFFHRYQTEAASKVIGGLGYNYAMRDDGQFTTWFVQPEEQWEALDALLKTLSPEVLTLHERIIENIPPRPLGYSRNRELFKTRTDLAFDPLAAAESAADMTLSLLLHPARATRLVEHNARDARQPALDKVIEKLIQATLEAAPREGLPAAVQMTVNAQVINNLIRLALNTDASAQARAVTHKKLINLRNWLSSKVVQDVNWRAHYEYLALQIQRMQTNPEDFKIEPALPVPPGQPIGCEDFH
jgi:hypothetical protein